MKKLKVLMTASEIAPFAKVGGLADVVSSLPPALGKLGVDVRLMMPKYKFISEKKYGLKKTYRGIEIPYDNKFIKVNIWEARLPRSTVKVYFIESSKYFQESSVYDGGNEQFLFFSAASLYVLPIIKFKPDIIHCHDLHTAMIPNLIKASEYTAFRDIKTLFTIHNLSYQGKMDLDVLAEVGLNPQSTKSLSRDARNGDINFMAQGIVQADRVNTVSPSYAKEIATKQFGAGLESVIRQHKTKISGIVNGIDSQAFNPEKDRDLVKNFSKDNLEAKEANKLALQAELGLPVDASIPVISLISRLVYQKGLELISEKMIRDLPAQFIFLGTGEEKYEKYLQSLANKYPDKLKAEIMFDVNLAKRIYAGSDMFLMPSRFEPCGLGQMIAMAYGTVPIVRATGGLRDTVDEKTGFSFTAFSESALLQSVRKAVNIYRKPVEWKKIVRQCLKKDFSWQRSAQEYLKIYRQLIK